MGNYGLRTQDLRSPIHRLRAQDFYFTIKLNEPESSLSEYSTKRSRLDYRSS